jgi:hypothetical protein
MSLLDPLAMLAKAGISLERPYKKEPLSNFLCP